MMIDPAQAHAALLARKRALERERAASEEERAPAALDPTRVGRLSRMDAIQRQEMALAAERRRRAEIAKIDAALRRLEAGDYGYCARCGGPIGAKRLAADPAAATCVQCVE